ncbi:MAG: TetR/AcrR family transcriptional regulator [bacterium]|nr:TetR/AcrR family transcriptional regulator [bacterium]
MSRLTRIPAGGGEPPRQRQRAKPVQQRSLDKINTILDAAAGLLSRHGVEAISMLAIAEAAGLPAPTVYHYFENRLGIFAALAERTMAAVDDDLTERLTALMTAEELGSRPLLMALYQAYHEAPGYVQLLAALRAEPALQEVMQASTRRIADVIAAVLVQRTTLSSVRAGRVGWILSESCDVVILAALTSSREEADALLEEMIEIVDTLVMHYMALH